jgi:threonine dehydrogenase-like Zn-dependent dehydrogenase
MRAVVVSTAHEFNLIDLPTPSPGPGEVLLRVEICGVCNSEVHMLETLDAPSGYAIDVVPVGPQPGQRSWRVRTVTAQSRQPRVFPLLLGHEVSGWVEVLGPGVSGVAVGQRVTALTQHGFADYALASAANLIALPDEIPLDLALGEPIGCAAGAALRAGVRLGDTVALVGAGFMGLLLLQFLVRLGAAQVIVLDPRRSSRDLAAGLGADTTLDPTVGDPVEEVLRVTEGEGADVVIEATGIQAGLDLAGALTRTRGRLLIYGYHQGGPRTIDLQLWNLRGIDVINAHQRADEDYLAGMRAGLAMLRHGKLDMASLVTHRFPLEATAEAFALAARRPEGFVKAVVVVRP